MKIALLIGAAIGVAVYLFACFAASKKSDLVACLEAGFCAAGIVAGLHLIVCAFVPSLLVEIQTQNGQIVDLAEQNLHVGLGEFHSIEIFLGGVAAVFVSVRGLVAACRPSPRGKRTAH